MSVPLQGVGNGESHFGAIRFLRREVKAGEGNDVAARFDDQRDATSRVRCGQPSDSRRRERGQPEEAVIPAVD